MNESDNILKALGRKIVRVLPPSHSDDTSRLVGQVAIWAVENPDTVKKLREETNEV